MLNREQAVIHLEAQIKRIGPTPTKPYNLYSCGSSITVHPEMKRSHHVKVNKLCVCNTMGCT